jgi:hypothetical protein
MDIPSAINLAIDYRRRVEELVSGEYADDTRTILLVAYADVALEHHEAIMMLLQHKGFGSAFSLVRILFEAFFRVHWVLGCASDGDMQKIARREFDFPAMGTMVVDIDARWHTDGFFETIKKQAWAAMNSYTHSGIRQLSRRFKGGRIESNYSDAEIIEVISGTTMAVLLLGLFFSKLVNRATEAIEAQSLIGSFAEQIKA